MEGRILYAVKWDLCFTPAWIYLQRYGHHLKLSDKTIYLARYFIEESLTYYKMIKFTQNLLACASIYLAFKFCNLNIIWDEEMKEITGKDESDLRPCAKTLCLCLKEAREQNKYKAAKRKFASSKFLKVSTIPELAGA
jgi:Cyclin, C-terminal domain